MTLGVSLDDRTPVLIGVGEASERIADPGYAALSPMDLAGAAARAALADAGASQPLAPRIDVIAAIRQFEISTPGAVAPFGHAENPPRAIARRIGADPERAILEVTGGQGPQHLVNEFAHLIARGEARMVLLAGAEAISTVRHLTSRGETRDWSEPEPETSTLEDRGFGLEGLITRDLIRHGAVAPLTLYALFENARRGRLGLDRETYRREMAALFAPFTAVAAANPHAMSRETLSIDEIATITAQNRLTCDPFPRRVVSRDQANQAAAVLMTSVGEARVLGVPQDRWVLLHGGADVAERTVLQRADLGASPAAVLAVNAALDAAETPLDAVDLLDLYRCFPVAFFTLCDGLGLAPDDPRGLTQAGGLPFFGGAGNDYSMHAIASLVRSLRARPGAKGLISANGGYLSKTSVGVYSTTPKPWTGFDSAPVQREVDALPSPPCVSTFDGSAKIETYTVDHSADPPRAVVVARTPAGERFVAATRRDDPSTAQAMIETEPLGARISVRSGEDGRNAVVGIDA
ncbi:acetyl-CoA acetyltransferase [soil metagenome]